MEVADSGRLSETPDAPVLLCPAEEGEDFELSDGHHRVVDAMRRGRLWVPAVIEPGVDDEPYEGPFYDFGAVVARGEPGTGH